MQACIGIRLHLQQELGAYHGLVYLATMMMHHLNGQSNGFQQPESLNFIAQAQIRHIEVSLHFEIWLE